MFLPVLKIEGKCLRLRAKPAHLVGHLPSPSSNLSLVYHWLLVYTLASLLSARCASRGMSQNYAGVDRVANSITTVLLFTVVQLVIPRHLLGRGVSCPPARVRHSSSRLSAPTKNLGSLLRDQFLYNSPMRVQAETSTGSRATPPALATSSRKRVAKVSIPMSSVVAMPNF
jgi:hypothetical protein